MSRKKSADGTVFWNNYSQLTDKDLPVIEFTKIASSTLSTFRIEKRFPRADDAYKIAKSLKTTVEYLVDGEDGKAYLREIVGTSPVREDLRDLVRDIETLSDQDIEELRALVSIKVSARKSATKHA